MIETCDCSWCQLKLSWVQGSWQMSWLLLRNPHCWLLKIIANVSSTGGFVIHQYSASPITQFKKKELKHTKHALAAQSATDKPVKLKLSVVYWFIKESFQVALVETLILIVSFSSTVSFVTSDCGSISPSIQNRVICDVTAGFLSMDMA